MAEFKLSEYPRVWDKRIKALLRVKKKVPQKESELLMLRIKKDAPRQIFNPRFKLKPGKKPGDTKHGIRRRQKKNGQWTVESWVPGDFKQNKWANRDPGYEAPKMNWNRGKPTRYGTGPATYTGKPMFFSRNVKISMKTFPKAVFLSLIHI